MSLAVFGGVFHLDLRTAENVPLLYVGVHAVALADVFNDFDTYNLLAAKNVKAGAVWLTCCFCG